MHVHEEGHAVYEAPALLLSRPAYVLLRKGWVVFPLCFPEGGCSTSLYTYYSINFSCIVSSERTSNLI